MIVVEVVEGKFSDGGRCDVKPSQVIDKLPSAGEHVGLRIMALRS